MFKNIVSFTIIFFLIYDMNFHFMPSVTTGRIAFLYLLLTNFQSLKLLVKEYNNFLFVMFFFLFISLVQSIFSQDSTQFSRFFYFILYALICPLFLDYRINNFEKTSWFFLIAISFQSLILIYTFFNPSFKTVLETYIIYGGNFGVENLYRSFGLSSSSGAALSLIQGLGTGIGFYILYSNKTRWKWLTIFLIVLCFFSTLFVGRTGLLVSFLFLSIYLMVSFNFINLFKYMLILGLVSYFSFGDILESNLNSIEGFKTDVFLTWISEGFDIQDNRTVDALLYKQPVPALTLQTLVIGTGTISTNGVNTSGHDSGIIQTYYSLGLILTFLFYFSLFYFLKKNFIALNKKLIYCLIILIFLLEMKEPFLFKYAEGFIILSFLFSLKFSLVKKINL